MLPDNLFDIFTNVQLNDQSKVEGLIFANPLYSQQTWSGYFWNKMLGMGTGPDILNDYHFHGDYNTDGEYYYGRYFTWI